MNGPELEAARRALRLLDLTRLGSDDTAADARALCERAATTHGPVAAVCLWPAYVTLAVDLLGNSPIRVATVANFPAGELATEQASAECEAAVRDGAHEVDVVFPYRAWQAGEERGAAQLIAACRAAVGPARTLKVILETGAWDDPAALRGAAEACVDVGADFLKTSTGKLPTGASPDAVRLLLETAQSHPEREIGVKASGGIRTVADAMEYLALADDVLGPDWARPATFRFGASGLLDAILAILAAESPA